MRTFTVASRGRRASTPCDPAALRGGDARANAGIARARAGRRGAGRRATWSCSTPPPPCWSPAARRTCARARREAAAAIDDGPRGRAAARACESRPREHEVHAACSAGSSRARASAWRSGARELPLDRLQRWRAHADAAAGRSRPRSCRAGAVNVIARVQAALALARRDPRGPAPGPGGAGLRGRRARPRSPSSPRSSSSAAALEDLKEARAAHAAARRCARTSSSIPTRSGRRWYAGADAVLLIVAALERRASCATCRRPRARAGLDALVEVHDRDELRARPRRWARGIIGVNNRDLRTMDVDLQTALDLSAAHPGRRGRRWRRAASSGPGDVRRLRDAGFDAFLVGEHLMPRRDPGAALEELIRGLRPPAAGRAAPRALGRAVAREDLRHHHAWRTRWWRRAAGADAIGLRLLAAEPALAWTRDTRAPIAAALPPFVLRVGVFVDAPPEDDARARRTRSASTWCSSTAASRRRTVGALPRPRDQGGARGPGFAARGRAALRGRARPASCSTRAADGGGAGRHRATFDWSLARQVRERASFLVLAGGLTPENVGVALDRGAAGRGGRLERRGVARPGRRTRRRCAPSSRRCSGRRDDDGREPDAAGHFGPYGGRYVPETLMEPLRELEAAYAEARRDPAFRAELADARCATTWAGPRRSRSRRGSRSSSAAASASSARTCATPARTRSTTRSARRCSCSAWARGAWWRRRAPGQHGVASATVCALLGLRVRRLHGHGGHGAPGARTSAACACWGPRCAPVDSRRAHAEGRDQRGHARLGHERAHHALPARLRAGRASLPDDGARLPVRDRRGGARAGARAARARCPTCWWPASAAAPTRSASSTRSSTTRWRWSGVEAGGRSPRPGDHAARFLGEGAARRACCTARAPTCCRTRPATCCPRIPSPPASTTRRWGPSTRWLRDEGRVRYDVGHGRRRRCAPSTCWRRRKGIIPALESSHALAWVMREAAVLRGQARAREPERARRQGPRRSWSGDARRQ